MFNIKTLNKISKKGLNLFDYSKYCVDCEAPRTDAIILRSYKMHDMEIPEGLLGVARAGAGTNNIPVDDYTKKGIVVFNTPGANANSVKELVLMSLFISSRKIIRGIAWTDELIGKGDEVPKLVEKGKSNFTGSEIKGKTLGVIGLGAIGVMVANDALSLGMNVIGFDPYISIDAAWGLSSQVQKADSIEALLAKCDYITLHMPLNDSTKNFINEEKIAMMKKGVKLLNFARGGLVDNSALKRAIDEEIIDRYVTDFPSEELLGAKNIVPIPHLGASTPEAEENCAIMAVNQITDFLETGNIKNSVNYPDCAMEMNGETRITIGNRNVPNMVGQISHVLAENELNIANMINRNKGDYAYNLIDIDGPVTENVIKEIEAIDGVIFTRIIEGK
ncbi:MAG: phosphoglycerate dehydrogenase [Spirochaetales bacterium]|uniref:D-3-phosphoglycerate dehydrogenase n=1 Tax=Candidatus Thalassospirochaeta sargassi TaxID=3119039 RepID=A0AAJ1IHN4_9SPIO|nr:phosphoglycerate dehydrogenase [Spirochaetales bacterium]